MNIERTQHGKWVDLIKSAIARGSPVFLGPVALRRRKGDLAKAALNGCSFSAALLRRMGQ